ncbi:hypothetical protein D3C86_1496800 [compost metagenome]
MLSRGGGHQHQTGVRWSGVQAQKCAAADQGTAGLKPLAGRPPKLVHSFLDVEALPHQWGEVAVSALDHDQVVAVTPLRRSAPHGALRRAGEPSDFAGDGVGDSGREGAVPETVDQQAAVVGRPGADDMALALDLRQERARRGVAIGSSDQNLRAQHQVQGIIFIGAGVEGRTDPLKGDGRLLR